jgi:hypothetical protein
VARIEKKMGLHGSATCVLDFDGAQGSLIGAEGQGLQTLFTMMNELRIEVALSAVGISACATAHAIAYANERRQGRDLSGRGPVPIIAHPDIERMIRIMRCLTDGGRALILHAACLIDLERSAVTADERAAAAMRTAWLLPICKATVSDNSVEVAGLGIQVRGGHGYVRESGAEQFLRDARVLPIYEGTNGIHGINLATRGLQRDRGAACRAFLADIGADLERSAGRPELTYIHDCLHEGAALFRESSERLLRARPEQIHAVLSGANAYLALAGRVALAWMWLRMAAVQLPAEDEVIREKRALANFYVRYFTPEFALHAARVQHALDADELPRFGRGGRGQLKEGG